MKAGSADSKPSAVGWAKWLRGRAAARLAFPVARALVFDGVAQPSGYTEPLLHAFRARKKAEAMEMA